MIERFFVLAGRVGEPDSSPLDAFIKCQDIREKPHRQLKH